MQLSRLPFLFLIFFLLSWFVVPAVHGIEGFAILVVISLGMTGIAREMIRRIP